MPELSDVRRFTHPWEQKASVDLRIGLADAIDTYDGHSRVTGGDRESMLDTLYEAWGTDIAAGKRSLMIAPDRQTVLDLNQRAHADRVTAGEVQPYGVRIAGGADVGVGDVVVTRQNNRRLTTGSGWVKNGDRWVVTATQPDGALTVTRHGGGRATHGAVELPAEYVADHVDLAYATTAHGAQGRTVDTAHAFVTATTRREVLYVAATRGRAANHLYVDTMYEPDDDTAHQQPPIRDASEVLRQVLATPGADVSATETLANEWADHHSLVRVWAEYQTLSATALLDRYDDLISSGSGLSAAQADQVRSSSSYGALLAACGNAESRGLELRTVLPQLVEVRTLAGADDVAAVLHERVDQWVRATPVRRQVGPERIVGLFPKVRAEDPDLDRVLREREALIERRTRELSEHAVRSGQGWVTKLGRPPADPVGRERWFRELDTIAAYREHWNITGPDILGPQRRSSLEQAVEWTLSQQALDRARPLHRTDTPRLGQRHSGANLSLDRSGPQL